MRYLGIDYGQRKTGLALSDESGVMGFPHTVVQTVALESVLEKLIHEKEIGEVVMGESKDFTGHDNPIMLDARRAAAWIESRFGIPVHWEPEMLTSAEARRVPSRDPKSRAPQTHLDVDASAAALILTSYLSRHHG